MITTDNYGRRLDYLRVSITDRCNLRCVYCMPPEGVPPRRREDILSLEQITSVVAAAAAVGFRRVRLTGGEPLVRRGVIELVEKLAALPGIEEVAMTTNAVLLGRYAGELAAAGLKRVNISLDSMRPERFRRMTRLGELGSVWHGIAAAERAGLTPIKINVVVVRGVNDDEIANIAALTLEHPWHVRFIEVMPIAGAEDWGQGMPTAADRLVPVAEMIERLSGLGRLAVDDGPCGAGPARYYRLPAALGSLGFISPISEHFCENCNRLRLTADGWLRTCLFSDAGVYLKPALDAGETNGRLSILFEQAVALKPQARPELPTSSVAGEAMSLIGG